MNREDILEKVTIAFSKVLEHNNFTLTNNTTADDVDGWESITHMMIISEIENDFNIKFKLMDLMNMNSIGDLLDSLESELKVS
ncbi:acyl carrier protein [Sabulilitoribacter multivorans]|uniref:Acyl carrier protein n=1 Tax=Flaviramulus multivorans TaxID=1304750 RepID=A0ABS9IJN0_9FLAO|nr:acyl carrier protein [Flaviramulus multivorans]MCF7560804.1 acyl carrier protein [Flaviramulus multivorans]